MRTPRSFFSLVLVAALLTGAAGGCGGKSQSSTSSSAPASAPPPASRPAAPSVPGPGPNETDLKVKPEIPKPQAPPPGTLKIVDLVKGAGAVARPGQTVTVKYVGVSYDTGRQFDASWDRGQPFPFRLGAGMVIPGWDKGVKGMRVGGRRQLVIPPDLAYGPQGQPPVIAPNATLIFDIDLIKAR